MTILAYKTHTCVNVAHAQLQALHSYSDAIWRDVLAGRVCGGWQRGGWGGGGGDRQAPTYLDVTSSAHSCLQSLHLHSATLFNPVLMMPRKWTHRHFEVPAPPEEGREDAGLSWIKAHNHMMSTATSLEK